MLQAEFLAFLRIAEDDDIISPTPVTFIHPNECSYKMHFHVTIHSFSPITNCECLSHIVTIENSAPHLQVAVYTNASTKVHS